MNPYLIFVVMMGFMGFGVGGFKLGVDHQKAADANSADLVAEAVDAANAVSAKAIADLRPKYTTIQNKVQHEVETHTIYTDCKLSPDGLLLANQALTGGTKPSSGGELPKADPTGK